MAEPQTRVVLPPEKGSPIETTSTSCLPKDTPIS
jgi:hypothetical protein